MKFVLAVFQLFLEIWGIVLLWPSNWSTIMIVVMVVNLIYAAYLTGKGQTDE